MRHKFRILGSVKYGQAKDGRTALVAWHSSGNLGFMSHLHGGSKREKSSTAEGQFSKRFENGSNELVMLSGLGFLFLWASFSTGQCNNYQRISQRTRGPIFVTRILWNENQQ